jgi:hypothetical protein
MKMPYQVPNYLAQTTAAMPQGQGMLRPLRSLEELQADYALADSDLDLADQLLSTGYIPDSGALGAVAMMVSAYQGKKKKQGAETKIADLMRESSDLMTRKEREELERAAAAERRKIDAAIKAGFTPGQAEAMVVGGLKASDVKPKEASKKSLQFEGGLIFDPNTGEVKKTPFYKEPTGPVGPDAPSSIRELQAYMALPPEQREVYDRLKGRTAGGQNAPSGYRFAQDGSLEAIPGGPADPNKQTQGPKSLTAEAATKLSLLENAKREAEAYLSAVSPNEGDYADIAARTPENSRRLESAIRAKLRAESGATIAQEEIDGEMGRYGPKTFSSDATNAQAIRRMIEDLDNQMRALKGGTSSGGGGKTGDPLVDKYL